jgi:hypothetical protein
MAKQKGIKGEQIPDPYKKLAVAVLDQAVKDLQHPEKDPLKAISATVFLV